MPENLERFATLGVDTAITEADVRSILPMDDTKFAAQAEGYSLLMESCLLQPRCVSFTVWGFTDKYQWVPGVFPGEGVRGPVRRELRPQARVRRPAP